jgi:hypothetical protein
MAVEEDSYCSMPTLEETKNMLNKPTGDGGSMTSGSCCSDDVESSLLLVAGKGPFA